MRHVAEAAHSFYATVLERPQQRRQRTRRGLQQLRQIQMIGAKPHPKFAKPRATGLIQRFDIVADARALQHAERFGHLKCDPAANAFNALSRFQIGQRSQQFLDVLANPQIDPRLHQFQRGAVQMFIRQHAHARLQNMIAARQSANRFAKPANDAIVGQNKRAVDRFADARRATFDFAGQRFLRCGVQRARDVARRLWVGRKTEPVEVSDVLTFDKHIAGRIDFRFEHCILSQATHQHACAPVDKPVG